MTSSKLLFTFVALSACTTGDDPPRVTKTFDFSGSSLDADLPARVAGPLNKATIRYAILTALPALRACGPTTSFEIQLGLVGAPDRPTEVATVAINGEIEPAFAACATRVLAAIDLPAMTATESWDVHYPIVVNAR